MEIPRLLDGRLKFRHLVLIDALSYAAVVLRVLLLIGLALRPQPDWLSFEGRLHDARDRAAGPAHLRTVDGDHVSRYEADTRLPRDIGG
ncbi:hypothetical protein ABZY14_07980 [Streptomyces sp. NPDC006617]|uniref:hypothetical protein n=1 Tax=Streptomyces sp. NPDC006617 TaxID=3155354 RepID=UPI0033B640DC